MPFGSQNPPFIVGSFSVEGSCQRVCTEGLRDSANESLDGAALVIICVMMLSSVGLAPSVCFIAIESGVGVHVQQTNDYKVDTHCLLNYRECSGHCALLVHYVMPEHYSATRPAHL